jgi:adenine/guanine phosphoribosyltransferase-like PRPP-binding protein
MAEELVPRLRRWNPDGWTVPAGSGTRATVAAEVVQRLADLGADAEEEPRRTVPILGDLVLADQLAVLVDDILRTGSPAAAAAAAAELAALRTALGY